MQKVKEVSIVVGLFVVVFMSGCAAPRKPVMIDSTLLEQQPVTISILPSIDARKDKKSAKIKDLDKIIHPNAKAGLKRRKYKVAYLDNYAVNHPEGYLAEMTDDELISLAPANVEAAFLFVLDDLTDNNRIIANSARIACRAYLIDPSRKKIIWKDEESNSFGGAGIAYAFMPMKKMAIQKSILRMIESIPKRGSKPK